jgi:hypothetical protein
MENLESSVSHICQNCGSDLSGNYCANCGQKRTSVNDKSISTLATHFLEEMFTWDSKFFRSVKYLLTRPGYLTHEYVSARIVNYVSPLKMFLFSSLVIFFALVNSDPDQYSGLVTEGGEDDLMQEIILGQESSSDKSKELFADEFNDQFNDNITLYIFVIMFFFSVFLKLVYLPKNYYYSEHIVFTLHFFTFVLWCFLFALIFQNFGDWTILFFLYIVPGFYLLISIKRVYHKTMWKAVIVSMFMTFIYWVLVTGWMIGSVYVSALRAA